MKDGKGRRIIKNRDIVTLRRVLYAVQDLKCAEQKRMWQQDRLYHMTQKITGMPVTHGNGEGLAGVIGDISEIEEMYAKRCEKYVTQIRRAEKLLEEIPSENMRSFVNMRYLMNMSNAEIMTSLHLSRWKFEKLCDEIELAQDMAHVNWEEDYILCGEMINKN